MRRVLPPVGARPARFFAEKLAENGTLYIVIRKQQGAESALKYLKTVFGQVETVEKSGGFWVIRCRGGKLDEI